MAIYTDIREFEKHVWGPKNTKHYPTKRKVGVSYVRLALLVMVFFAVNTLSGGHTFPTIQRFYPGIENALVLDIIGAAGFLGLEGVLVILMALEDRGAVAWIAIAFTFIATAAINMWASASAIQDNQPLEYLAVFVGLTIPAVNMAIGELVHRYFERLSETEEEADAEYKDKWDNKERLLQKAHNRYLDAHGEEATTGRVTAKPQKVTLKPKEQDWWLKIQSVPGLIDGTYDEIINTMKARDPEGKGLSKGTIKRIKDYVKSSPS